MKDELLFTFTLRGLAMVDQKKQYKQLKRVMYEGIKKVEGIHNTLNCLNAIVYMEDFEDTQIIKHLLQKIIDK